MSKLKMTPRLLHILLSLHEGERHGYGILQDVRRRAGSSIRLGTSSLYWSLGRLEEAGMIETVGSPGGSAERRRYYRVTDRGRSRLREELRALESLVDRARSEQLLDG